MPLNSTDLFVVQSQQNKALYKLSLNDLQAAIEGGSGVNFRGQVDLLSAITGQINPDPAANGDMYIVEQDAPTINATWSMADGVTSANENDRVIWDGEDGIWILVTGGSNTGGTIVGVVGTAPIQVNVESDATTPVVSITEASVTEAGAVERLAAAADVVNTNLSPSSTAVVTADLLQATNKKLNALELSPGGVTSVNTDDVALNDALTINPTTAAVKIEIKTAAEDNFGVVSLATAQDIIDGTSGANAVIDAAQLKDVIDVIPETADFGVLTIAEGGTNIVDGALEIANTSGNVTLGVTAGLFVPADFESLPDITV